MIGKRDAASCLKEGEFSTNEVGSVRNEGTGLRSLP